MKKLFQIILISLILTSPTFLHASELKIAIIAPEGSAWSNIVNEWDEELKKKTGGQVQLKIYAGGVSGDEKDVLRKMKIGQIHMGGFTGLGLGIVNSEVRVLELPMLFKNYEEVDYVTKKIQPKLEAGFDKKGFVLLGWAETGFVNIFSNKPIAARKHMDGMKMWQWEGDHLVNRLYNRFAIVPIQISLPDVLTSLSTNMIDAVYAPPLGAIALQWYTKTKYMTDLKLANSTGGILITKKAFLSLSEANRKILKETAVKYAKKLVGRTRLDNETSYKILAKSGIVTVNVEPEEVARIEETSKKVWTDLVGKLYSQELLDETVKAVEEYRKSKK